MILDPRSSSGFSNMSGGPQQINMYDSFNQAELDYFSTSPVADTATATTIRSLLYNFSILKEKVHQVQPLISLLVGPDTANQSQPGQTSLAAATMGAVIQEIIGSATSMAFACQQMNLSATADNPSNTPKQSAVPDSSDPTGRQQIMYSDGPNSDEKLDWYSDTYGAAPLNNVDTIFHEPKIQTNSNSYDIIELDPADLLAKYTHYCQVCGKGFKRDANLRMHMRAHGDEYKNAAALCNPGKVSNSNTNDISRSSRTSHYNSTKKYSCPQEGCKWNKNHAKFTPLKSMICVKNHYKRTHCPKMYVCKRCNAKRFSVLSDLWTHEKHCGELRWQCSCGTNFSRKDKLMGHMNLFAGHRPVEDPKGKHRWFGQVERRIVSSTVTIFQ